jgi:hypothetical protein
MTTTMRLRRWTGRLGAALTLVLIGFSLGAVSSARATAGRASTTTLQAILEAVEALTSGLRPPSNGQTRLLFPLVSTYVDGTTLQIVNTGQDPSGALGHDGSCALNLFGETELGGPGTFVLPPLSVGVGRLSSTTVTDIVVADFTGYAIATCDFPLAHGQYQLRSGGAIVMAEAALILPPTRSAAVVEALGQ